MRALLFLIILIGALMVSLTLSPAKSDKAVGGTITAAAATTTKLDWNSETEISPDKKNAETTFHQKWIGYLDSDGTFKDINTDFTDNGTDFVMTGAPFTAIAPHTAAGVAVMHNNNRFNPMTHSTITDPAVDMTITAVGVTDVVGKSVRGDLMTPTGLQQNISYVVYPGAYENADLIYYVDFGRAPTLEKLLRFQSAPTILDYSFDLTFSAPVDISFGKTVTKTSWDQKAQAELVDGKQMTMKPPSATDHGIGFKKFQIWDSTPYMEPQIHRNIRAIDVKIQKNDTGGYRLTKVLPADFFDTATYPVYTDTSSTFFPDPDTEVTSVDGRALNTAVTSATYSVVQGAAGDFSDDNSTANPITNEFQNATPNHFGLERAIYLFDTSSLPDAATITAATFSIFGTAKTDTNWTSHGNTADINIVSSNPTSNTAVGNADYATSHYGSTVFSTAILLSAWSTTAYNDFALNASGLANISKTSISKFGARDTHDITNTAPTLSASINFNINGDFAEVAGTANDPKLVVTYSTGASFQIWPLQAL